MQIIPCDKFKAFATRFGPLAVRLALGIVFVAHGMDKLWGTFGGGGLQATASQFEQLGLHPGWFHAMLGGGGEFVGGLLVLLGLLTPLGALLIAATMVVAIATVHIHNGLFARDDGFEYPLIVLGAALSLFYSGPGCISLDALLFGKWCSKSVCVADEAFSSSV